MGFWDDLFDPPSVHKNRASIEAARRNALVQARRATKRRKEAQAANQARSKQIGRLQGDLATARGEIVALKEQVALLTRCLIQNEVIDQAALDATLPAPDHQDFVETGPEIEPETF